MNPEKEYQQYIKLHRNYEVKNLQIILKEFRKIFKDIIFDNLTPENARYVIALNLKTEGLRNALYKIYYTTGRDYGNKVARQIRADNPIEEKKFKPLPFFNELYQQFLVDYFQEKAGEWISILSDTMVDEVHKEIIKSTLINETVEQMRDRIYKTVNKPDFYKWQAMRIARTETTFAMNKAKEFSGIASGIIMEKVWIGKNDGRERDSHIAQNGEKVEQNGFFEMSSGVKLRFPGDRDGVGSSRAMAKELINCRCTYGYEAKRDESGRLIFTDSIQNKPSQNEPNNPDYLNNIEHTKSLDSEITSLKNQYDNVEERRRKAAKEVNDYYTDFKKKNPKLNALSELEKDETFQELKKISEELAKEPSRLRNLISSKEKQMLDEGYLKFKEIISNLEGETNMIIRGGGNLVDDVVKDFKKLAKGYNDGIDIAFLSTNGREGFDTIGRTVRLNSSSSKYTVIHELSHSFELDENVLRQSVDFLERRTKDAPLRSLKEVNSAFNGSEYYKDGGFFNPYVGKSYKADADSPVSYKGISGTEIISMGIEQMYRNPTLFFIKDPDHYNFIFNLFFRRR